MSVTAKRAEPAPRIRFLALVLAGLAACSRQQEEARSVPDPPVGGSADSASSVTASADTGDLDPDISGLPGNAGASVEETVNQVPRSGPNPAVRTGKAAFLNRPQASAWPGRPWVFTPVVANKRAYVLRLVEGPEGMAVKGASLHWTPSRAGRFQAAVEAGPGPDTAWGRLTFTVDVRQVLTLHLKTLPEQARKGDTVTFDLKGSAYPPWAEASLTVRFDYEGDGKWDTEALPLAAHLRHARVFATVGRFAPRVEARYLDLETRTAEGRLSVIGTVEARLILKPDTVEPGGAVSVDASGSRGDGRLAYRLDLDGDGKVDWSDSATGRATLKAPSSGRYQAALTVRNPMGQEGKAAASLVANARPKAVLRIRNARENMAAPVEVLVDAADGDDSLRALRIDFTGSPGGRQTADRPDSAKGPGRWRKTFRHAYGRTGKFVVTGCAVSADGREGCAKAEVEIYNAQPIVESAPALRATVGVPAEIVGIARDPDGTIVKWEWDLDGDGKYDLASRQDGKVKYTFARKGTFSLNLRVTTADGMTAVSARKVEVRNP